MAQAPRLDPQLDRCVRHDGLHPELPRESTTTSIEWPFTASQARSQRLTFLELVEESGEETTEDNIGDLLEPLARPFQTAGEWAPSPLREVSNHELQAAILAPARQTSNHPQKKLRVIKEPNPFNGESLEELCIFVFQCQIYFYACEGESVDDADKVFFTIFYLQGIALDYFEPFINKLDPYHNLNFLENWSAFVQKLSNIFGSYLPKDDDEDTIVAVREHLGSCLVSSKGLFY